MCGIFGYKGSENAKDKLMIGLKRLEYRGYDSAGIFVANDEQSKLVKAVWKISNLSQKVDKTVDSSIDYDMGIAHTRWATHGGVNYKNTHPHHSSNEKIYLVHNGIIENYMKLRKNLKSKWYQFYSDTDTEVVVKLIEDNRTGDLWESVEKAIQMLEGAYGLLVVDKDNPDQMVAVRYGSPLIFAKYEDSFYFSSDLQALSGLSNDVIFLEDGDVLYLDGDSYQIKSKWELVSKPMQRLDIDAMEADKSGYEHFMFKEIQEQPAIVKRLFKWRLDFDNKTLRAESFRELKDRDFDEVVFIACGTSYHASCVGAYWINSLTDLEASTHIASEYEFKNINIKSNALYVFVSQSGETADTIGALKQVKSQGGYTFGIVNVVGSSIAKQTDVGMFTRAGTEIWVASTKAFTAQITNILLLSLFLGRDSGGLSNSKYHSIIQHLQDIPTKMRETLAECDQVEQIAKDIQDSRHFIYMWRNYQLPISNESALKFKEITYKTCDSYSAGELKHWPLALVDEEVVSMLYMPVDVFLDMNISSLEEIKARDGKIVAISDKQQIAKADYHFQIPDTIDELYPFLTVLFAQLMSYYMWKVLWKNIDKPRNLAKSVTVR